MSQSVGCAAVGRAPLVAWAAAALFAAGATAQTANTAAAALSLNGTGLVDAASGLVLPTNSQATPAPTGGAPLYWHRAQARGGLEFRVQGVPFAPIILVAGTPGPPIGAGAGSLELTVPSLVVIADGLNPFGNLLNATAATDPAGNWKLALGSGVAPGTPNFHFQAAVVDPTAPLGIRLTGSLTLETKNDLESLMRNVVDAATLGAETPFYGPSLATPGFKVGGLGAIPFFLSAGGGDRLTMRALSPNATNLPALPTGAPTPGQTSTFSLELESSTGAASCTGLPTANRDRVYELRAVESFGSWKFAGDQRDVALRASVAFYATTPAPAAPNQTRLEFNVWNEGGLHAGVALVTLTGPQLAGVVPSLLGASTAASSASGTLVLPPGYGNPDADWSFELAVGAAGTSRQPLVEDASGPRDVYFVTVHWNDGATSGPYAVPLRCALDPSAAPAAAAAAIPGLGAPSGVLTNVGLPTENLALTFAVGAAPGTGNWSAVTLLLVQGSAYYEFADLLVDPTVPTQTLNLCVPGLLPGVATNVYFERHDLFADFYRRAVVLTF